jgi:hypothetical protein
MGKNKKYYVWIGGTFNIFDNLLDAEIEQIEWNEKGYKDVYIELK